MKKNILISFIFSSLVLCGCSVQTKSHDEPRSVSGIYPELAYYNNEGECGTGAVVPWADRLWVITYGPHLPNGSSDKLYEITPELKEIVRVESIGGTPANRMIHRESNQLLIGPYLIDSSRNVRVIPYSKMYGRLTGNARHLTDPAHKVYYGTMEEGFYEVDVNTLDVNELSMDGNKIAAKKKDTDVGPVNDLLPGVHGKGMYSGQGHVYYSNNGEGTQEALKKFDVTAGVLAEWDGKDWKVVRRNQFTDITGPGGIYGNSDPANDPIWAIGWDYKSLILGVRNPEQGWSFYRLPKASHSYDGAHGWNTEWPRIRNIGTESEPDYMMTMHGMFWNFPGTFCTANSAGIRPRSAYLKVIGDFARWNNRLVFGCDDSAKSEFLNKRNAKGKIGGTGQSNSNLWFTSISRPDELGPATAEGAVWEKEKVKAGEVSEPFLFSGWDERCCWIKNIGKNHVRLTFEIDENGRDSWKEFKTVELAGDESMMLPFSDGDKGEWIRVKADEASELTVSFNYTAADNRTTTPDDIFKGLSNAESAQSIGGFMFGLGNNRKALGLLASKLDDTTSTEQGYYELDSKLNLELKQDDSIASHIRNIFAIPRNVVTVDDGSVLIVDNDNRRWRLPLGGDAYKGLTDGGVLRICREVATERDLFSCEGTFYELPAENADGYAKIRPISSHNFRINDYASYRGMLLMTGVSPEEGKGNDHVIVSKDGRAAVWAGVIDDLWALGKPVGHGGPWVKADVKAGEISDPYLIGFYDQKSLTLTNNGVADVTVSVQADPTGNGDWMDYAAFNLKAGKSTVHVFPDAFQAIWIRFKSSRDANITTWLEYR